jgi:hypothetical protein
MKNFKKVLAFLCSATLIVGSSVTAFATAPTSTAGTGNIVAFSVETVTVPTSVKVSFNPQGYDIITRGTGTDAVTSDKQIVSLNYGISSMATLDKKVTVTFTATGATGTGSNEVVFVDSLAKAQEKTTTNTDGAAPGEYKMYLAVAPSDAAVAKGYDTATNATTATDFKIADDHTSTVTAALLADVDMTAATSGVQAFANNKAELVYKLNAAEYELKDGETFDFTTAQSAVAAKMQPSALGDIVGFTFIGAMNPNVDWTKAKITALSIAPTYKIEDVDGTETVLTGAGAGYHVVGEAAAETTGWAARQGGGYTYTFASASKPTGAISAIVINGSEKAGPVTNNVVTYNASTGVVTITADAVAGTTLTTATSIAFMIGGQSYNAGVPSAN